MRRLALAGLLVSMVAAAPAEARVVDRDRKVDDHGLDRLRVDARVIRPRELRVSLLASDERRRRVGYHVVCERGTPQGEKAGSLRITGTGSRELPMPIRRPASCTYTASVELLGKSGATLTLRLHAFGGRDAPERPAR